MQLRILFATVGAACSLLGAHPAAQCEVQKILSADAAAGDLFGTPFDVSQDVLLIGAPGDDDAGASTGACYVFERSAPGWVEAQKLLGSDSAAGDGLGDSLALWKDVAVIAAHNDDDLGSDSGSVYIFERLPAGWIQTSKLTPLDGAAGDNFGESVAIEGDTLAVGAWAESHGGVQSGAAYVFQRTPGGVWTETAKLVPSDGQSGDGFGESLALSGSTIMVCAEEHSSQKGAVYAYELGPSGWQQASKLMASDAAIGDEFGTSVAIDGDVAIVAASKDDDAGTDSGSVYVFYRFVPGTWSQVAKVLPADVATNDAFGNPVALEGSRFMAGSRNNDDQGSDSGSAYVFELVPGGWQQAKKLLPSDGQAGDGFGSMVALWEGVAYVGARMDDDHGPDTGSAFVFLDPADVTLTACPPTLSLSSGGTQQLRLAAGAEHADQLYVLLGSASGIVPGTPVGSILVPLNFDAYSVFVLTHENQPPYFDSLGVLSSSGVSLSKLTVPAGTEPALAGTLLFHADLVLDPISAQAVFCSNAALMTLVP